MGDADQDRPLERRASDGHKLPDHALLVGVRQWQVRQHASEQARTASQEEVHRVEQYEEMEDEKRCCSCSGGECGEEEGARASDEFTGLRQDLRSVGFDAIVAWESPQSTVEFTRLIDELLETRPDRLGDAQRFIGAGSEDGQERCHH